MWSIRQDIYMTPGRHNVSLWYHARPPRRALPMFYVFFEAAVYGGRTPRRRHPRRGGHDLGSERQQRKV